MVDKIMIGGDERTSEVEQIQVGESEGDDGRMGEESHILFSFMARETGCEHARRPFQIRMEMSLCPGDERLGMAGMLKGASLRCQRTDVNRLRRADTLGIFDEEIFEASAKIK